MKDLTQEKNALFVVKNTAVLEIINDCQDALNKRMWSLVYQQYFYRRQFDQLLAFSFYIFFSENITTQSVSPRLSFTFLLIYYVQTVKKYEIVHLDYSILRLDS